LAGRIATTGLLVLALPASAGEWQSDPQEIHFGDTDEVFDVLGFDSGYLPSFGSPISVRFHVTPTGGIVTDMDCESQLQWQSADPSEPLEHLVVGVPGSGWFGVDADIAIEAEVHINIFGLWTGSVPLWTEHLIMAEGAAFDPPLLGESLDGTVNNQNLIDPLEYDVTVFLGLDLVMSVNVYPELTTRLEGLQIDSDGPVGSVYQSANGAVQTMAIPGNRPQELPLTSTYWAEQTTVLNLVLEPSVRLDTLIGPFELLAFPIPISFVDDIVVQSFERVEYSHPLPATAPLTEGHDFGDVDLGTLVNLEIPFENVGLMGLEGSIRIDGDGSYTVYPDTIYAQPGAGDGVVVTFAPNAPGIRAADVVFESNDPSVPIQLISLVGNGWSEPPDDEPAPDTPPDDLRVQSGSSDLATCGCSIVNPGSWWWIVVFGVIAARRRRPLKRS